MTTSPIHIAVTLVLASTFAVTVAHRVCDRNREARADASVTTGPPADLYLVHRSGAAPAVIVRGVDASAMRTPEPTPPPPLPVNLPQSAHG